MQSLLSVRFWALEETFFEAMKPLVLSRLQAGHDLSIFKVDYEQQGALGAVYTTRTQRSTRVFSQNPRIAMIPLMGTMTKYGGMCSYGTTDLIKMIDMANADPDVDAIVMVIDTPGGTVVGTREFGNAIAQSPKPVVGFVDVTMASAGVWAGSQADHLIINSEESEARVGSIGTLYVHINNSKHIENNIGEVKIIRAPQSTDKARINPIEPLTADLEAGIVAELKEITDDFINTVKTGRGSRLKASDDTFTGKMYNGQEAKKRGLVDGIGTLEDAVKKAADLARTGVYKRRRNANNQSQNNNQMSLKNWFSGATSDAENAGSRPVEVQAAELNQLKADMQASVQENETLAAENKKLKTEKADTEAQLAEAQQTIAAHEATIDSQKAKIDELEKKPAAASTTVKKNEDVSQSDEDPTYQSVDRSWNEKANKALGF